MQLLITGGMLGSIGTYAYHALNKGRFTSAQKDLIKEESTASTRIQSIFQSVLNDMNLDKNCKIKLLIVNGNTSPFKGYTCPHAYGNLFLKERGVIVPIKFFDDYSDEVVAFIFRHEITHIQKNHLLKIPSYSFLAGIIPLVVSYIYPTSTTLSIASSALSTIATIYFYTRFSEVEADAIAASYLSSTEISLVIIGLCEKIRSRFKSLRASFKLWDDWRYHLFTEEGDCVLDVLTLHPSMTKRQASLERTLKERQLKNSHT